MYYPRGKARLTLYKEPDRNVTSLFMKDDLLAWFKSMLRPGDIVYLEALYDANGVVSLRFSLPRTEKPQSSGHWAKIDSRWRCSSAGIPMPAT